MKKYGKRRSFRKPFYRRKSAYKIAKRAAKSVLWKNSETKWAVFTWNGANITVGDRNELLGSIAQGTGKSARIGNTIKLLGLRYKLTFVGNNPNDHIRCMFALPKDYNIYSTASVWPTTDTPVNTDVMRVFRDTDFLIDADTNTQRMMKGKILFKGGRTITYTPAIGNMDKPLVLYTTSNHGLLTYPKLYGYVKVYFKDV